MADIIHLAGNIQLNKSGNRTSASLWTATYNDKLAKDIKTLYTLWLDVPESWTDNTWVEIKGTLSVRPNYNQDGTPRTYMDSKGNTITAHQLNVNDIQIMQANPKTAAKPVVSDDSPF